jgi:hypothetical protein
MAQLGSPLLGGIQAARTTVPSSLFRSVQSVNDDEAVQILKANQFSLSVISTGIIGIQQRIGILGNSLTQISNQLTQESFLEQNRIRQEQEQERRLAEQQAREGKESLVERRIQGALLGPVQAIAKRTQGILERLKGFFLTLLAGWLTNQLFETIKAYSEGNTKKLEEIKDNVLKTLGVVGGILLLLNGGFLGIVGKVGILSAKILGAVTGAIFKRPFQALAAAVSKLIPQSAKNLAKSATAGLGAFGRGVRSFAGGAFRYGVPLVAGALEFTGRKEEGQTNLQAAAGTGASLAGAAAGAKTGAVLGSFLGPVGTFFGTVAGGFAGYMAAGKGADILTGVDKPKVEPTQTKTPTSSDLQMNGAQQDFKQPPAYGEVKVEVQPQEKTQEAGNQQYSYADVQYDRETKGAIIGQVPSQSIQAKMQRVAPLPEPEPTILTAPVPQPQMQIPSSTGNSASTNVPAISSSNPENFYVLYSQMHYNVVI